MGEPILDDEAEEAEVRLQLYVSRLEKKHKLRPVLIYNMLEELMLHYKIKKIVTDELDNAP